MIKIHLQDILVKTGQKSKKNFSLYRRIKNSNKSLKILRKKFLLEKHFSKKRPPDRV